MTRRRIAVPLIIGASLFCLASAGAATTPKDLVFPCELAGLYNPDGDGWMGMDASGAFPLPVVPELWLVGPPPSEKSGVTLPTDHWVELGFCGPIADGPGPDILVTEQGKRGEQALILLSDGEHCPYPIGLATADSTGDQSTTEIFMDLEGMTLPFVPTRIRVVSLGLGGDSPGFDLGSVGARIVSSQISRAAYPSPADHSRGVSSAPTLRWSPGRGAQNHVVYFGPSPAEVGERAQPVKKPQQPQEASAFSPGILELGRTYYWRVDEIVAGQSVVAGEIWQFEVAACEKIADFESSLADWQFGEGRFAWVGASRSPDPVYEGGQSMALHFGVWPADRTGVIRTFSGPQDWASLKATTFQLAFRGHSDNVLAPRPYVTLSDGTTSATIAWEGDPNVIRQPQWHLWTLPLAGFQAVDLARVRSLVVGVSGDAASYAWGTLYLDAIALCCRNCDPAFCRRSDLNCDGRVDYRDLDRLSQQWLTGGTQHYTVREPNQPAAWFPFDGDTEDHEGSMISQTQGQPTFVAGRSGQALSLAGVQRSDWGPDSVTLVGIEPLLHSTKGITIAFWQNGANSSHAQDSVICSDFEYGRLDPGLHIALGCWGRPGGYQWHCGSPWTLQNTVCGPHRDVSEWTGRWNHWAFTVDLRSGERAVFLNGATVASQPGPSADLGKIRSITVGNGWYGYYDGLLDDLRFYDYPLSLPEVAYLATDGSGVLQPMRTLEADLNSDGQVDGSDFAALAQDWLAGPISD
jgi:hypothetical protein